MKKFTSSIGFNGCAAVFFAVLMLNVPLAAYITLVDKGPSWYGLDVSWVMALNYAFIKKWTWGTDIIYTYGPLGWLATRNGWGVSRWLFVAFDGFMMVNFFFVFHDFLEKNSSRFIAVLTLAAMVLALNQDMGSDLSWGLLFLIVYWMVKTFYDPRPVFLIILITLTVLAFYIKMNTSLLAMMLLCFHFVNLRLNNKIPLKKIGVYVLFFIVLIGLSAVVLHVSIFSYIYGSLELIKGYNDVMYLHEVHPHVEYNLYLLFIIMTIGLIVMLWGQVKEKKYNLILYTLSCIGYLFLLQKQSILRNDVQHLYEFFSFAPIIFLSGLGTAPNRKWYLNYTLVITLLALFFVSENRTIDASIIKRVTGPYDYLQQLKHYKSLAHTNQQGKRYIPPRVLKYIGNKTIDVFPWDLEYAVENGLNYSPPPVFQSHMVYTPMLEKINYDYYVNHPPQILIFDYDAIDNRYPFNEESLVNLFVIKNYTLVDAFTSNERPRMLLQKNSKTNALQLTQIKKQAFLLKDTISTWADPFIKLDIHYNLRGTIKAFFNRPPAVWISYQRQNGQWFSYKTSPELLKTGMYVDRLITNNDDYMQLITNKPGSSIKKIKLVFDGRYFDKKGTAEYYSVK